MYRRGKKKRKNERIGKKQKQNKITTENSETECFFWEEIFKRESAEEQNDSCIYIARTIIFIFWVWIDK